MNSFWDISQISDIHSMSRTSRSSNSRIVARADSVQSLLEQQYCALSTPYNASRSTVSSNQGTNCSEKTLQSFGVYENSLSDFIKNRIVLQCIEEASQNTKKTLPNDVIEKLKGILLIFELNKYMHLPSTGTQAPEESTVLGITDLPKHELSYTEKLDVKCCVENILREKIHNFVSRYENSFGSFKEVARLAELNIKKKLSVTAELPKLQYRDKIEDLCSRYKVDLTRFKALMNDWNKLKYKDLKNINVQRAEYLLLQAQVASIQAKITKLSCMARLFNETPITTAAFKTLNATLSDKLHAIVQEIREKEVLKKQYDNLQNTEYDDVLKAYLDVRKSINKKKQILQNL